MAGGILVVGEAKGHHLARTSAEVATLARSLADARGLELTGLVAGSDPAALAGQLAAYLPRVIALGVPDAATSVWATAVAPAVAAVIEQERPSWVLIGATSDGRDLAGAVGALLGWGVLVAATDVRWGADRPQVEMSVFGGRLLTTSEPAEDHCLITVRAGCATATPAPATGSVDARASGATALPSATLLERIEPTQTTLPVEDARIVVAGGRGVGGPDGFRIVQELADILGGAVGATRAAVDAGWIDYGQQVGQTGKTVKPDLYIGLGLSGAIQHTVGIQGGCTVVAITKDSEARIIEFADLVVVGDLFQVGPALAAELRARAG